MRRVWIVFVVASLFAVNVRAADAADVRKGLYVGTDLMINVPEQDLQGDFVDVDPGSGIDVKVGYLFPIPIALEIELGASGHRVKDADAGIGLFGINLRYLPLVLNLSDLPLLPYIRWGVGKYALVIDNVRDGLGRRDDLKLTGSGFDVGVGFDLYVRPEVSLGVGLTQRFVKYDKIDFFNARLVRDVKGSMTSLSAGVQYHF